MRQRATSLGSKLQDARLRPGGGWAGRGPELCFACHPQYHAGMVFHSWTVCVHSLTHSPSWTARVHSLTHSAGQHVCTLTHSPLCGCSTCRLKTCAGCSMARVCGCDPSRSSMPVGACRASWCGRSPCGRGSVVTRAAWLLSGSRDTTRKLPSRCATSSRSWSWGCCCSGPLAPLALLLLLPTCTPVRKR